MSNVLLAVGLSIIPVQAPGSGSSTVPPQRPGATSSSCRVSGSTPKAGRASSTVTSAARSGPPSGPVSSTVSRQQACANGSSVSRAVLPPLVVVKGWAAAWLWPWPGCTSPGLSSTRGGGVALRKPVSARIPAMRTSSAAVLQYSQVPATALCWSRGVSTCRFSTAAASSRSTSPILPSQTRP
jgi:hypothetical protein